VCIPKTLSYPAHGCLLLFFYCTDPTPFFSHRFPLRFNLAGLMPLSPFTGNPPPRPPPTTLSRHLPEDFSQYPPYAQPCPTHPAAPYPVPNAYSSQYYPFSPPFPSTSRWRAFQPSWFIFTTAPFRLFSLTCSTFFPRMTPPPIPLFLSFSKSRFLAEPRFSRKIAREPPCLTHLPPPAPFFFAHPPPPYAHPSKILISLASCPPLRST